MSASLIAKYGKVYTIKRTGAQTIVEHRPSQGAESEFEIVAHIQPVKPGREAESLAPGDQDKDAIRVYTVSQLAPSDEVAKTKGDRITYKGREYRIKKHETWEAESITLDHNKYIAVIIAN